MDITGRSSHSNMEPAGWRSLPLEVWLLILDLLPFEQSFLAGLASHAWRNEIWAHTSELIEAEDQVLHHRWIELCAPHLRRLSIDGDRHLPRVSLPCLENLRFSTELFPGWLDAIDKTRLRRLSIENLSSPLFAAPSNFDFPNLKKLKLFYCKGLSPSETHSCSTIIVANLHRMPNLEELQFFLPRKIADLFIQALPSLPRLRFFTTDPTENELLDFNDLERPAECWAHNFHSNLAFASVIHIPTAFAHQDHWLTTILGACTEIFNLEALKFFVSKGVPVDLENYKTGETALDYALRSNRGPGSPSRTAFVEELLRLGANPNHFPKDRSNPLARSVAIGRHTKDLLAAGAEPPRPPDPIIFSAFTDSDSVIEVASKFPWTVNQRGLGTIPEADYKAVLTPLAVACSSGAWKAFDFLWERSDERTREHFLTARDSHGMNSLAYCFLYADNSTELEDSNTLKLMQLGLDPFIEIDTSEGNVPLFSVMMSRYLNTRGFSERSNAELLTAVVDRHRSIPNFSHLLKDSLLAQAAFFGYEHLVRRLVPTLTPKDPSLWSALSNCLNPHRGVAVQIELFCQILTLNLDKELPEDVKDEDIRVDCSVPPELLGQVQQGHVLHPMWNLLNRSVSDPRIWNLLVRAGLDVFAPQFNDEAASPPLAYYILLVGYPIEEIFKGRLEIAVQADWHRLPKRGTALMIAANRAEPKNVKFLLKHSTREQIEQIDAAGDNALLYALRPDLRNALDDSLDIHRSQASNKDRLATVQLLLDAGLGFSQKPKTVLTIIAHKKVIYPPLTRLVITAILPFIAPPSPDCVAQFVSAAIFADSSIEEIRDLLGREISPDLAFSPVKSIAELLQRTDNKAIVVLDLLLSHPTLGPPLLRCLAPTAPLLDLLVRACEQSHVEMITFILKRVGHLSLYLFVFALDHPSTTGNPLAFAALLRAIYVPEDFTREKLRDAVQAHDEILTRLHYGAPNTTEAINLLVTKLTLPGLLTGKGQDKLYRLEPDQFKFVAETLGLSAALELINKPAVDTSVVGLWANQANSHLGRSAKAPASEAKSRSRLNGASSSTAAPPTASTTPFTSLAPISFNPFSDSGLIAALPTSASTSTSSASSVPAPFSFGVSASSPSNPPEFTALAAPEVSFASFGAAFGASSPFALPSEPPVSPSTQTASPSLFTFESDSTSPSKGSSFLLSPFGVTSEGGEVTNPSPFASSPFSVTSTFTSTTTDLFTGTSAGANVDFSSLFGSLSFPSGPSAPSTTSTSLTETNDTA